MNKIRPSFRLIVIVLLLLFTNTFAQETGQKFLSKIPALPQNFCQANDDTIMKWNDKLLALKNEMIELQVNEKQQMEQAQSKAQPRMNIFESANIEKIQKLGEKVQGIETDINNILNEITSPFIEKRSIAEVKYQKMEEALEEQKKVAIQQGGKAENIIKRIHQLEQEKCGELSLLRKNYLTAFRSRLNELIELGAKENELSDEMIQLNDADYSFRTKYGLWLGFLETYVDELLHIYDDLPPRDKK